MGDGFLSFNTEFSNPTGYYISTFTNALVGVPMQLGTTLRQIEQVQHNRIGES